MSIEITKNPDPSHEENIIYFAECLKCQKISEESGDFLPGNFEVASFGDDLTLEQVIKLSEKHEKNISGPHKIVIRGLDIGKLQKQLGC